MIREYYRSSKAKKIVLFPEISWVKFFYHSPACMVERVSEYIFLVSIKNGQKTKEFKEEKRISEEKLTGYDGIIWELALCTFNLLDQIVNFSWLFI